MKKTTNLLLILLIGIIFIGCGSKIKEEQKKVEQVKEQIKESNSEWKSDGHKVENPFGRFNKESTKED